MIKNIFIFSLLINLLLAKIFAHKEQTTSHLKYLGDSCNTRNCIIAVDYCGLTCKSVNDCKNCIINYDSKCANCADSLFDKNEIISFNGITLIGCYPNDFYNKICLVYCKANGKTYGKCLDLHSFGSCFCYAEYSPKHNLTITESCEILTIEVNDKNSEIALGSNCNTVTIYDIYGRYKRSFEPLMDEVYAISFLSNGDIFLTGDYGSRLFSNLGVQKMLYTTVRGEANTVLRTGQLVYAEENLIYINYPTTDCTRMQLRGHTGTVKSLLLTPDDYLASASADSTIKIWNIRDGSLQYTLIGHSGPVTSLIVLETGALASGSWDRSIKIWNPYHYYSFETEIQTDHTDHIYSLALLPNGKIASGSQDGKVKIYDKEDHKLIKTWVFENSITSLAVSSEKVLFIGGLVGELHIYS